jgi:hypothetical protein
VRCRLGTVRIGIEGGAVKSARRCRKFYAIQKPIPAGSLFPTTAAWSRYRDQ